MNHIITSYVIGLVLGAGFSGILAIVLTLPAVMAKTLTDSED